MPGRLASRTVFDPNRYWDEWKSKRLRCEFTAAFPRSHGPRARRRRWPTGLNYSVPEIELPKQGCTIPVQGKSPGMKGRQERNIWIYPKMITGNHTTGTAVEEVCRRLHQSEGVLAPLATNDLRRSNRNLFPPTETTDPKFLADEEGPVPKNSADGTRTDPNQGQTR